MNGIVFVNGRFKGRPITGVERYAGELARRLFLREQVISPAGSTQGLAGHLWEQAVLPDRLPPGALLWSPANTGPLCVSNQAVTIHDLAPLDHPEWYRPAFRLLYRLLLPALARNCRLVITDSQFSRNRIARRLGLPPDRIALVPGGVDQKVFYRRDGRQVEAVRRKYGLQGHYLLAVGTLQPRKNLRLLVSAWQQARQACPDLSLVIAGEELSRVFQHDGLDGDFAEVCLTGRLPDDDLAALYSGALAFVLPSLYEGFGLTLLEAMACGAPLLASSAGALPETAGEAALYFDPHSSQSLASCLLLLLQDPALRQELVDRGAQRVQFYSWETSARILKRHLSSLN